MPIPTLDWSTIHASNASKGAHARVGAMGSKATLRLFYGRGLLESFREYFPGEPPSVERVPFDLRG
jgi:hypothetical protein